MRCAFRSAACFLFSSVCLIFFTPLSASQNLKAPALLAMNSAGACAEAVPDQPRFGDVRSPGWELSAAPGLCNKSPGSDRPGPAPLESPAPFEPAKDPVEQELLAAGATGAAIAEARDAVLDILENNNACSAWYRAKEQDAAEFFRSLEYKVDAQGPVYVQKTVLPHDYWIILQPYVAWSRQNVGPGSTVTLNAHGAFFVNAAMVLEAHAGGGPTRFEPARLLEVGGYTGGTLRARELTLLHELGHVIDLLPLDAGVPRGPEISMHNTEQVVAHCKAEVDAESRRVKKQREIFSGLPFPEREISTGKISRRS
jgi:hypothetical protein